MAKTLPNSPPLRYKQLGKTSVQLTGSSFKIVTVDINNDAHRSLSSSSKENQETRMILLVGGSGHGKTKLLNAFVNYLYDVKLTDNVRYFISEDDDGYSMNSPTNRTRQITKYIFNGTRLSYQLIVVDTPGIGGERHTAQLISDWIQKEHQSQSRLNAIAIVTKGTETRLTTQMRNEFEQIFSLFPPHLRQHSFLYLLTFCDASQQPAIKALHDMNLDCNAHNTFTFNSSAFSVLNGQLSKLQEMLWSHGMNSADALFKAIAKMPPQLIRAPIPRPRRHSSGRSSSGVVDTDDASTNRKQQRLNQSDTNQSSSASSARYDPNPRVLLPPVNPSNSNERSTAPVSKQIDPNPRVHLRPQTLSIAKPIDRSRPLLSAEYQLRPPPSKIPKFPTDIQLINENSRIDQRLASVRTTTIDNTNANAANNKQQQHQQIQPSSLRSSRASTPSSRRAHESVRFRDDTAHIVETGSIVSSTIAPSDRPLLRHNRNNNSRHRKTFEHYFGRDQQKNLACYGGIIFIAFVVVVLLITLFLTVR